MEEVISKDQQIINIIKRQTDYDEETIKIKLKEFENNVSKIILEYNVGCPEIKKEEKNLSNNQKIFKVIRENFS